MARLESVDTIKIIAIFSVIIIHTAPFNNIGSQNTLLNIGVVVNQMARFAVPFFFLISGYFWGVKLTSPFSVYKISLQTGKRIFSILVLWSLFYLIPYNSFGTSEYDLISSMIEVLKYFKEKPLTLLLEGTKVHLWFLVSLLHSLVLCAFLVQFKLFKTLKVLSLTFFVFAVLANSYSDTPLGITTWFNTRNGPFFSTIFFATGYFLSQKQVCKKSASKGVFILLFGLIFHFIEIYILNTNFATNMKQDFVFGTYFMGLGTGLIAISNHSILNIKILSHLGKMTLGIYAIHVFFVELLMPIYSVKNSIFSDVSYIASVLILSILTCTILSKNHLTRRMVM